MAIMAQAIVFGRHQHHQHHHLPVEAVGQPGRSETGATFVLRIAFLMQIISVEIVRREICCSHSAAPLFLPLLLSLSLLLTLKFSSNIILCLFHFRAAVVVI